MQLVEYVDIGGEYFKKFVNSTEAWYRIAAVGVPKKLRALKENREDWG